MGDQLSAVLYSKVVRREIFGMGWVRYKHWRGPNDCGLLTSLGSA